MSNSALNIGVLLPTALSLTSMGDGRRAQAIFQADALEQTGQRVSRLTPWDVIDIKDIDVVHVFECAFGNSYGFLGHDPNLRLLAMAPFLDSNQPNFLYRLLSYIGFQSRLNTVQSFLRTQFQNADLIIARSRFEQKRFIQGLGIPEEKTQIVLNGITPPSCFDLAPAREVLKLPEEFVLHVSTYTQARKNVIQLVKAIIPLGIPLVIAGDAQPGPILDELKELIKNQPQIQLHNFLDRKILNSLYANAKVFALPSVHEGTGLVALDAASYGANIVITKNGGPVDYFREYAEYVDPADVQDIRTKLSRAWNKPRKNELQQHILDNLTWEKSAQSMVAAYHRRLSELKR